MKLTKTVYHIQVPSICPKAKGGRSSTHARYRNQIHCRAQQFHLHFDCAKWKQTPTIRSSYTHTPFTTKLKLNRNIKCNLVRIALAYTAACFSHGEYRVEKRSTYWLHFLTQPFAHPVNNTNLPQRPRIYQGKWGMVPHCSSSFNISSMPLSSPASSNKFLKITDR